MTGTEFTITMAIVAIIAGVLGFSAELVTKFPKLKFIDNLLFKIVLLVLIGLGTMLATISKDNKTEEDNKVLEQRHLKREDSIANAYTAKLDGNNIHTMKMLLDYNLTVVKGDSTIISKLSDSALNKSLPDIHVTTYEDTDMFIKNDSLSCNLSISNDSKAVAKNITLYVLAFGKKNNSYVYFGKMKHFDKISLQPNTKMARDIIISNFSRVDRDSIFFKVFGTYTAENSNKKFSIYNICFLSIASKRWYIDGNGFLLDDFIKKYRIK